MLDRARAVVGSCLHWASHSIHVDDARAWHARLDAAGVEVTEPVDEPWGKVEFHVIDPDRNRIRIGSPTLTS